MKIIPRLNFSLAGSDFNRSLVAGNAYPAKPATNLPDYESRGLIFVPFDPADSEFEGDSILLETGDYTIAD